MAASPGNGWTIPGLADVLDARRAIAPYLQRTPLHAYAGLDELVGTETYVKHENHLPTGAFKVRGGVNLVAHLTPEERARGLIAASTGNHGQSMGFAGRLFGVRVIVCVPERANPAKLHSMRALGVELVEHGRDFDEAREHSERLAARARVSLRPFRQRASPDRRSRDPHARGARAGAAARRDRRPHRRRQRRGRHVRRREGGLARL